MSSIARWVELPSRKPYAEEYNKLCLSIWYFILLHMIFSKILLKLDNKDIGL